MIITRGIGYSVGILIITRGYGVLPENYEETIDALGALWIRKKKKYPKRDEKAKEFIVEVKERVLDTGVVRNTHKPYHPRWNPRYPVDEYRAEVIAYDIARRKGLQVGRKPAKKKK